MPAKPENPNRAAPEIEHREWFLSQLNERVPDAARSAGAPKGDPVPSGVVGAPASGVPPAVLSSENREAAASSGDPVESRPLPRSRGDLSSLRAPAAALAGFLVVAGIAFAVSGMRAPVDEPANLGDGPGRTSQPSSTPIHATPAPQLTTLPVPVTPPGANGYVDDSDAGPYPPGAPASPGSDPSPSVPDPEPSSSDPTPDPEPTETEPPVDPDDGCTILGLPIGCIIP